jgi:hypothetical protein
MLRPSHTRFLLAIALAMVLAVCCLAPARDAIGAGSAIPVASHSSVIPGGIGSMHRGAFDVLLLMVIAPAAGAALRLRARSALCTGIRVERTISLLSRPLRI